MGRAAVFEECHGVAGSRHDQASPSRTARTRAAASFLWECKGAPEAVGEGLDLRHARAGWQFQGCKAVLLLNAGVAGLQCADSSSVRSEIVVWSASSSTARIYFAAGFAGRAAVVFTARLSSVDRQWLTALGSRPHAWPCSCEEEGQQQQRRIKGDYLVGNGNKEHPVECWCYYSPAAGLPDILGRALRCMHAAQAPAQAQAVGIFIPPHPVLLLPLRLPFCRPASALRCRSLPSRPPSRDIPIPSHPIPPSLV